MSTKSGKDDPASFRDPSGVVFSHQGSLYREIHESYRPHYDTLMESGLYQKLVDQQLLVSHVEVMATHFTGRSGFRIIQPTLIPFITYPYEWAFGQLKAAALATLTIQQYAIQHGMTLKDASAYNIQFQGYKPVLIDTLSFERIREGQPWIAYRQFCQHFLAPLALMAYRDIRLGQLSRIFIDGIPLDFASSLLPRRTFLRLGLLSHIHLHSRFQRRYSKLSNPVASAPPPLSKKKMLGLLDSLQTSISNLTWKHGETEWADYQPQESYSSDALEHKIQVVRSFVERANPSNVWDLGANTGLFSRVASKRGIRTIAFDSDPTAVEKNYQQSVLSREDCLTPLVLDLNNPSASIGWAGKERLSLRERGPADLVMSLAIIHHLAISNNLPFPLIASFFCDITEWLIIEFVPKDDPKVEQLLVSRMNRIANYTEAEFRKAFGMFFEIITVVKLRQSQRTLFLMKRLDRTFKIS